MIAEFEHKEIRSVTAPATTPSAEEMNRLFMVEPMLSEKEFHKLPEEEKQEHITMRCWDEKLKKVHGAAQLGDLHAGQPASSLR